MKRRKRKNGYLAIPSGILAFALAMLLIVTGHCFDGGIGMITCSACVCWMGLLAVANL